MPVHEFKVEMSCDGCVNRVNRVIARELGDKVDKVSIDLESKTVKVSTSKLSGADIYDAIKKSGKPVTYVTCRE